MYRRLVPAWGSHNTAFIMYIRVYKPTVIYFRLTNSLATFQIIINDLFHDIVNQENMVTFINDIIVAIKTEERYDKIVGKVLK